MPWALIAYDLRSNPGEWAVVDENGGLALASACDRINRGESWFEPKGAYQAKTRTVRDVYTLYARYVGPEGEHA